MSRLLTFLCWAVFLASCHDAPRDNPFDPVLTPAVELQVALDDTAGTATLTWTRYEGQQPFREYWVLRNIAERTRVDTLVRILEVEQTAYVDTTLEPNTAYVYRVAVVNTAGYEIPSEERSVTGFSVGVLRLLGVEPDSQAGTLSLRWNRYVGPDFAGYQLHRRQVGTDQEEILAAIAVSTDTAFADHTAQAGVDYLYTLNAQAAGQALTSNAQVGRLDLPPVKIVQADFRSTTASASLVWTQYRGARFKGYQVLRWVAGLTPKVVHEAGDLADTSFVDTDLSGNTEYFYQVVVETTRDEEVKGEEVSSSFHHLVGTWPLEVAQGEYVRLYDEGDHLTALVTGERRVRLFLFDPQGTLIGEQVLLDTPLQLEPRSGATYLSAEGRRHVSAVSAGTVMVLGFGADGQPLLPARQFFADSLSAINGAYLTVKERGTINTNPVGWELAFFFYHMKVSANGQVLFEEDFEGELEEGWDGIDKRAIVRGAYRGPATKSDEAWQDFYVETDVLFREKASGGISIGTGTNSSLLSFSLNPANQQVRLRWTFAPGPGSSLPAQNKAFTESFFFLPKVPYRIGLGLREGQFSASVSSPGVWSGAQEGGAQWTSLAGIAQSLVLMHGDHLRTLSPEGEETLGRALEEQASETRIWEWEGSRGPENWLGFCLPARHQLLFNRILVGPTGNVSWSTGSRDLGAEVGQGTGAFLYPLSFDASPDGRVFVLDAGNARIQVFDTRGKYITQWGHRGSGEGEFDFGSGRVPEDFAGSVAVDDEGYIYVADVGNRRIQKFAP